MAIYKPSNFYPNLREIDLTEDNTFTCQVNTSGETVKAYKIGFLSGSNKELFMPNATSLDSQKYVKNKGTLSIPLAANISPNLVNGDNLYYKWNLRLYNAILSSTSQPNTKVCDGYLTGSTKSVIWTGNNTELQADRWAEIKTTGSTNIMPILEPNDDNINLPASGEEFIERYQITWITKDLGFEENITKIEFDDEFKYNYINGTTFDLYNCSSEHGNSNFFTDPNGQINLSNYVVLYSSNTDKTTVEAQGNLAAASFPYTSGVTIKEQPRKIIGYSSDTGEIRVEEAFSSIPKNGYYYVIYAYNSETNIYELKKSITSQRVGGAIITSLPIMTNSWTTDLKQLFIQPNINIKTDATNPNEIVFDNGVRTDIIQEISSTLVSGKNTDITIDKLDNSQWLLKYISTVDNATPPIIPKSTYTIYTDFIDSSPDSIFYPRTNSTININYENLNSTSDNYQLLTDGALLNIRDIAFKGVWNSLNNVAIKYYKYYLIDKDSNIIGESEEVYNNELTWSFKGLEWDQANNIAGEYTVKLDVTDAFNKIFSKVIIFKISYPTTLGVIDAELDCDSNSIKITVIPPKTIAPVSSDNLNVVSNTDINRTYNYLQISENEILNYGTMTDYPYSDIIIPSVFSLLTQFQITSNFLANIPIGGELPIFTISCKNSSDTFDYYTLKSSGFEKFSIVVDTENNSLVKINNNQFHIKLYLNDSDVPLKCFDNGESDYCDISEYLTDLYTTQHIYYALQQNNGYTFIDTFPSNPDNNLKYVLKEKITYNNVVYYQGIYTYNGTNWNKDISTDYVFVDNLNQVLSDNGYSYSDLNAPLNTQGNNGDLLINTDGNIWLDTFNTTKELNEIIMDSKWLVFYLTVNDVAGEIKTVRCFVEGNNRGV